MKLEDMLSLGNILRSAGLGLALTGAPQISNALDNSVTVTVREEDPVVARRREYLRDANSLYADAQKFFKQGDYLTAFKCMRISNESYEFASAAKPKDFKQKLSSVYLMWATQLIENHEFEKATNVLFDALKIGNPDYETKILIYSRLASGCCSECDQKKLVDEVKKSKNKEALRFMKTHMSKPAVDYFNLK